LIVVYRMFDRPDFELTGFEGAYELRYGIFVALAGAALVVLSGLRARSRGAASPREESRSRREAPPAQGDGRA
jgi:hypothetical protein